VTLSRRLELSGNATGWGDGPITEDGCAVELYRRLPDFGEAELIASAAPRGASVLELGAGAGRLTRPLLARAYRVTAVDQSAEMLACIQGAERVRARIETLDLAPRRFDVVLLASYLLNTPDPDERYALLLACRRHIASGGKLIAQVRGPGLLEPKSGLIADADGVRDFVDAYERAEAQVSITLRVEADGRRWVQRFTHVYLDAAALRSLLTAAGFAFEDWIAGSQEWFCARPA
jgi:SAM-dependent methyltransferase